MADLKISQLTTATTPLAGTEVLPIVQSSTTKKVAVSDVLHSTADYVKGQYQNGATNNAPGPGLNTSVKTTGTAAAGFGAAVNFDHYDSGGGYAGPRIISSMPSGDPNTTELVGYSRNYGYVEGWRVDIAGNIKFPQNAYFTTAAKGVNFTANTPAAGMTSQLLNWYEEGTFTPVAKGTTTAGTGTYSIQVGTYTRIGRRVFFTLHLSWSAHTGTGNLYFDGLPFASNSTANLYFTHSVWASNLTFSGQLAPIQPNNSTSIFLDEISTGAAPTSVAMDTSAEITITGSYEV